MGKLNVSAVGDKVVEEYCIFNRILNSNMLSKTA